MQVDQTIVRGALIKFNNIMAADFSGETFLNVGAFTIDHLSRVLYRIKGEYTKLDNKGRLPYLKEAMTNIKIADQPFFTDYLSCCLIYANSMHRLRILGQNTFDNVWLIDRQAALQNSVGSERASDYGLILYLRHFLGRVQIGGPRDDLPESVNQQTVFKNLLGYLNPFTIKAFGWDPSSWLQEDYEV